MPVSMEKYDPFVIPVPVSGINMNIDEEFLPSSYAASMINLIPNPFGSITLRNGTQQVYQYAGKKVLYVIPYVKLDGTHFYFTVCVNSTDSSKCDLFYGNTLLFTFVSSVRMRGFSCMGEFLLCDGVDPIQIFNESTVSLSPLSQQITLGLTKSNLGLFSVVGNYYDGIHLNPHIYAIYNGIHYTVTPVGDLFTLTDVNGNSPDISANNQVLFVVYPPYAAFCTVIGGRLWFTGEGGTSRTFKVQSQAMLISYSFRLNILTDFLDSKTGLIPSLSLSNITSTSDSIDRIEQYKNFLLFFGKKQIYVYNGFYPEAPNFDFFKSIPFGIYHPDLLKKIADDILFVSDGGFKKLSTTITSSASVSSLNNLTLDVSVSDINGLDLFVIDIQRSIIDADYLNCSTAFYALNKQVMFKLGSYPVIVFSCLNGSYIPYLYEGDFRWTFGIAEGNNLVYLAYGQSIIVYQEEYESQKDFISGDLSFLWKTPTRNMDIKTFTSQHVVINAECDPQFSANLSTGKCSLTLDLMGMNGRNFSFSKTLTFQSGGDFLNGFKVRRTQNYGILPSIEFKQILSLTFNKVFFILSGRSSQGRFKIKNIAMRGIFSHG